MMCVTSLNKLFPVFTSRVGVVVCIHIVCILAMHTNSSIFCILYSRVRARTNRVVCRENPFYHD